MILRKFALSTILLAAACSNKLHGDGLDTDRRPDGGDTDTVVVDADGDGFPEDEDCDDTDPRTFPGADEECDGEDNDCDGAIPETETDVDSNGTIECEEECGSSPGATTIATLADCEYTPDPATSFETQVEWSMTQEVVDPGTGATLPAYTFADEPTATSVLAAPIVAQLTDDDADGAVTSADRAAIAVVMHPNTDDADGVLRVVAGDGAEVIGSVHWSTYTNKNGTYDYAPYKYSGLAAGNLDGDAEMEIVALAYREDGLCYPAIYEVASTATGWEVVLDVVYPGANYTCGGHAPALADLTGDGDVEVILGKAVFDGDDLKQEWYGTAGRGWYGRTDYADGYWNSGYHAFAYDMDGDGTQMEVVAGRTVYNSDGSIFCALGSYSGSTWTDAKDGYPAVADVGRFSGDIAGEPEIVLTGNGWVRLFHGVPDYDPTGAARCTLISEVPNAAGADTTIPAGLPKHPSCSTTATSFGGPPTIADFDGDLRAEIGVAGSCYYSVYDFDDKTDKLSRYAMAETRDWSSASTGSTVFDFNGDQQAEVVFSDELAVYVWGLDTSAGLDPWERFVVYLEDTNHKSFTVHEYPLVADVDNDGKAEIVATNAHLPAATSADTSYMDRYGIYVIGARDDNWVTARPFWNQSAYFVTNVDSSYNVGYGAPNYAPYTTADLNSFRQQAPGEAGALQASNLRVKAQDLCQEGCGAISVRFQIENQGKAIAADRAVPVSLYGVSSSGKRSLIDDLTLGVDLGPGEITDTYEISVGPSVWTKYVSVVVVADDPAISGLTNGLSQECDETDNETEMPLVEVCP